MFFSIQAGLFIWVLADDRATTKRKTTRHNTSTRLLSFLSFSFFSWFHGLGSTMRDETCVEDCLDGLVLGYGMGVRKLNPMSTLKQPAFLTDLDKCLYYSSFLGRSEPARRVRTERRSHIRLSLCFFHLRLKTTFQKLSVFITTTRKSADRRWSQQKRNWVRYTPRRHFISNQNGRVIWRWESELPGKRKETEKEEKRKTKRIQKADCFTQKLEGRFFSDPDILQLPKKIYKILSKTMRSMTVTVMCRHEAIDWRF